MRVKGPRGPEQDSGGRGVMERFQERGDLLSLGPSEDECRVRLACFWWGKQHVCRLPAGAWDSATGADSQGLGPKQQMLRVGQNYIGGAWQGASPDCMLPWVHIYCSSHCCSKTPDRSHPKSKRFALADSIRGYPSIMSWLGQFTL